MSIRMYGMYVLVPRTVTVCRYVRMCAYMYICTYAHILLQMWGTVPCGSGKEAITCYPLHV